MAAKISYLILFVQVFLISGCSSHEKGLRKEINFNQDWSYSVDSLETGYQDLWYKQGLPLELKEPVTLPHTWNIEKGLERYFGLAWYEKNFEVPAAWQGKKVRIKFGAVHRDAAIYLNGELLKEHIGAGYTTFYVDLTPDLEFGKSNRITVACDNSFTAESLPYKKSFDWANDGGIHRNVDLIITHPTAIDYAHITPEYKTGKKGFDASMYLKLKMLENNDTEPPFHKIMVKVSEENQDGKAVVLQEILKFDENEGFYTQTVEFDNVNLWHFDNPNLYKVELTLLKNGKPIDQYTTITGFKRFEVKNGGFFFNDEQVRLPGIEWMPGSNPDKGFAEDTVEIFKMLRLMKEVNAVFTRFHWPQDERVIDWCNRNGILVQEEVPHWQQPAELSESVSASIKTHLHEMIRRDYNAPCIFAWGLGNEIPGQQEGVFQFLNNTKESVLNNLDATRLISFTSNSMHRHPANDAGRVGDFLMWNDYYGTWYGPETDRIGFILENIHHDFPDKPLCIAEFGLCEPTFKGGDERRRKDMTIHIDNYLNRDFIGGAIYFSLNDYRTHFGESGKGRFRQRIHGVTDLIGKKKPSYELLKQKWSPLKLEVLTSANTGIEVRVTCRDELPAYTIRNYSLQTKVGEDLIEQIKLPKLKPGESRVIRLKKCETIHVYRPGGFLCGVFRSIEYL